MSRRRYRKGSRNRLGDFFVCIVVLLLIFIVSVKCVELKARQNEYLQREEMFKNMTEEERAVFLVLFHPFHFY